MTYRIGIDAGSKTIKAIVLDEADEVVFATYRRHRADICRTFTEVLHDLNWRLGGIEGTLAITGSAGIAIAEQLGVPFVQEVVATTHVVKALYPAADAVIELGGEDAKVIYLTDGVEQRMNATCAGGTGGFIDTIAFMLGVRPAQMSQLANGARHLYPIASRCAVFAQTDVRPLLNAGASKADIAASALDAVVRQTLGGLACGRPIRGTVVFLGGPLEHMPYLVHRFRRALGLGAHDGIKPRYAHTFTARGAAILSERECTRTYQTSALEELVANMRVAGDDLERLPPLFQDEDERKLFCARHQAPSFPKKRAFDTRGPLYVGIDAGSTTVKLAVLDSERNLVHSAYEPTCGDTLGVLRDMLLELYGALPRPYGKSHDPYVHIAHVTATGYGEDLLLAALGVDSGVVETAAHLRAAQHLCPDVSFVLDIGGQDMKALWVSNGQVSDAVLNEACSSGCGSFIEGTAHSLKSTPWRFAEGALRADAPVDLGTKCTVFMTSRVRHAQKAGASIDDIAAGIAYSVVQNALYRIIGVNRVASMGDRVVVQGGAFKSDAVLRAFELVSGKEAVRCEQAHLMGAIGAALIAAERGEASAKADSEAPAEASARAAAHEAGRSVSALLSREELAALKVTRRALTCTGCPNACTLSAVEFGGERAFITGNKCERGADELERQNAQGSGSSCSSAPASRTRRAQDSPPPNIIALQQRLIRSFADVEQTGPRGCVRIGVMSTLEMYEHMPFWHALLASLGFSVAVPQTGCEQSRRTEAWETVPSESVCYAAKITHARFFSLADKQVDAVLMARFNRGVHCPVSAAYADALGDNLAPTLPPLVSPMLISCKPERIAADAGSRQALMRALEPYAARSAAPLCARELDRAIDQALEAQRQFQDDVEAAARRALNWLADDPKRHGIVMAGRPYHHDAALMHDIDRELQRLGFAVLPDTSLTRTLRAARQQQGERKTCEHDEAFSWKPAKHLVRLAQWVVSHPQLDMICLQSFGCGFDAVSIEEARRVLYAAKRPCTTLKIDDISDTAHIRIRLRTLAEAIESRVSRHTARSDEKAGLAPGATSVAAPAAARGAARAAAPDARVNAGAGADASASDASHAASAHASLLNRPLGACDLEAARRWTVKDACFTANVMAARAIVLLQDDPNLKTIRLPRVCDTCLTDAVPHIVERATGKHPAFIWEDTWPDKAAQTVRVTPAAACTPRPRVGVLGNPLLCFEPYMNDNLVETLADLGCTPVLPAPDLLRTEDVRYLRQLEAFAQSGVCDVIYLLSFGCLKGHVHARGALHELKSLFPTVSITVIDFDPEASALNRENRVRLAVEAAWEKVRQDPQ